MELYNIDRDISESRRSIVEGACSNNPPGENPRREAARGESDDADCPPDWPPRHYPYFYASRARRGAYYLLACA
jgi:hypothetical protein